MSSKIALGTAQFGLDYGVNNKAGQVGSEEVDAILALAKSFHINTLDTAIAYGESEKVLGSAGVAEWQIISKLSALPVDVVDVDSWVEEQIRGSCQRLKVEGLYGLLLHRPAQLIESRGKEIQRALCRLKEEGLVKKVGISVYEPDDLDQLFSAMKIDIVQAPFNLIDRSFLKSGWIRRLQDKDCEFHARSVFLQGLLLMNAEQRPSQFDRWQSLWNKWDNWLKEAGLTPLEACLRYALSVEAISKVVLGVESTVQLNEIFAAASGSLPEVPSDLAVCDKALLNPALWVSK